MIKVKDAMKSLLDSTRAMSQRAVDLSNACGDADARDQDFISTQLQLDQSMRSMLDESVGKALDSLDRKLAPFKDLEERVKKRNNLKLDYDHYVRKVRADALMSWETEPAVLDSFCAAHAKPRPAEGREIS